MAWTYPAATGLERFRVASNEFVTVRAGYLMAYTGAVLIVDGVLRLDGAVKVG